MNKKTLSGFVLLVLGIALIVLGNVGFDQNEELIRFGDFRASATTKKTIPLLRYTGAGFIGGGLILLVTGIGRKK